MIPDGPYTAVVDEIEAGSARLELESPDDDLYDLYVDTEQLPADGRHESAVLNVDVVDEALATAEHDGAETERRQESMHDRFDRLAEQPPNDDTEQYILYWSACGGHNPQCRIGDRLSASRSLSCRLCNRSARCRCVFTVMRELFTLGKVY